MRSTAPRFATIAAMAAVVPLLAGSGCGSGNKQEPQEDTLAVDSLCGDSGSRCGEGSACVYGLCLPVCSNSSGYGPRPGGLERTCGTGRACVYSEGRNSACASLCDEATPCPNGLRCKPRGSRRFCFPPAVEPPACEDFKVLNSCATAASVKRCGIAVTSGTSCGTNRYCSINQRCDSGGCLCNGGTEGRCCNGEEPEGWGSEREVDCRERFFRGDQPIGSTVKDYLFFQYCETPSVAAISNPGCAGTPTNVNGECRCADGRKLQSPCGTAKTCEQQCRAG